MIKEIILKRIIPYLLVICMVMTTSDWSCLTAYAAEDNSDNVLSYVQNLKQQMNDAVVPTNQILTDNGNFMQVDIKKTDSGIDNIEICMSNPEYKALQLLRINFLSKLFQCQEIKSVTIGDNEPYTLNRITTGISTTETDQFNLMFRTSYAVLGKGMTEDEFWKKLEKDVDTLTIGAMDGGKIDIILHAETSEVSYNVPYTMEFYNQSHKVTVHYVDENGNSLKDDVNEQLSIGETYSIESPTIEGRSADKGAVSGTMGKADIEETVVYKTVKPTSKVTYYVDGVEWKTWTQEVGQDLEVQTPEKEGYTFSGWAWYKSEDETNTITKPEKVPEYNINARGTFSINSYTITYMLDDKEHGKEMLEFGKEIKLKEVTPEPGYTFSGWTLDGGKVPSYMPARDITLAGTCKQDQYTVIFQDENGKTLETYDNQTYNSKISVPTAPVKDADKTYTYSFKGWQKEGTGGVISGNEVTVMGSAVYKAVYEKSYIDYTVTFQYVVGTETREYSKKTNYHYGDLITFPTDAPFLEPDGTYRYEFKGWRKDNSNAIVDDMSKEKVTGNHTYTAEFTAKNLRWQIRFLLDDQVLLSGEYVTGETIQVPDDPVKLEDAAYIYKFVGWKTKSGDTVDTEATKDADYYAQFDKIPKEYTLHFFDESGNVTAAYTCKYGDTLTLPTAAGKKGTDSYSYEFLRWESEAYGTISSNQKTLKVEKSGDFKPVYQKTEKKYKIEFLKEDGTVFQTNYYKHGASVSAPEAPEKEADKTYSYEFTGWQKSGSNDVLSDLSKEVVKGDTSYKTVYKESYIYYKVTFKDWDDREISSKSYKYSDTITKDFDNPTRQEDKQNEYQFKGWSPEISNTVTENVTYIAQYEAIPKEYRVGFQDADGKSLYSVTRYYGSKVDSVPADPTKMSDETYIYTFAGWKKDGDSKIYSSDEITNLEITEETVFTAFYEKSCIEYTVTFLDQNKQEISKKTYRYGDKLVKPNDLGAYEKDGETYTFIGWSPQVSEIVEKTVTYEPIFYNKANMYMVTFYNDDGTVVLDEQSVIHGGSVAFAGSTPVKDASNYYTYAFDGWTTKPNGTEKAELDVINEDIEVFAAFSKTERSYVVDFVDEDGSLLSKHTYQYHDGIVQPEAPVKESDAVYDYTFLGWNKEVGQVTGNETFQAQYKKTFREYKIVCMVDEIPTTKYYHYDEYVSYEGTPARENTKQYTYHFKGWKKDDGGSLITDISAERVTKDVVYTAVFDTIVNKYTVSFYDENGVDLLGTVQTEYAGEVTYPRENPIKASNLTYDYVFEKWIEKVGGYKEANLSEVTGDCSVYASYKQTLREYTIEITTENVTEKEIYHYGDSISWRGNPTKEMDAENTYEFVGWRRSDGQLVKDLSTEKVEKNQTYKAEFKATKREYTITWKIEGKERKETYYYGQSLLLPVNPEKEGNVQYSYPFVGWRKDGSDQIVNVTEEKVTGNAVYEAKFDTKVNQYTVTFYDETGTILLGTSKVDYGKTAKAPTDPVKDATVQFTYTFSGWDKDISNVTENIQVKATFQASLRSYTVTWSVDGTEITEDYLYGYLPEYKGSVTKPATEIYKYDFAGWDKEVAVVTGSVTYYATYKRELNYVARIGNKYYNSIKSALDESKTGDVVMVDKDCEITTDVLIPSGVTLFLPCQEDDVPFLPSRENYNPKGTDPDGKASLYRKIKVEKNATVTVEGTLIVNAITGRPKSGHCDQDISGGYAQIDLDGKIFVESGGLLDVSGYVKGSGDVTALDGSTIYDLFVVRNWRGGSQGLSMYMKYIYPMNESDCHNIEVPIRIHYGASYEGTVRMYANSSSIGGAGYDYYETRFPQVNVDNGLIRLTGKDGYVVKTYEGGYERYTISGGAKFAESTLVLLGQVASTSDFIYPIDGDIIFNLKDGDYSFENDYKFLPGSQLNLAGDASLRISEKKKVVFYEEFNDKPNTDGTEYPSDRPSAVLNMASGSSLHISGRLGGIVNAEDVKITKGDKAKLTITTEEANGYLASTTVKIKNDLQIRRDGCAALWEGNKVIWDCNGNHCVQKWINTDRETYQTGVCVICGSTTQRQNAADYVMQEIEGLNADMTEEEKEALAIAIRDHLNHLSEDEQKKVENLKTLTNFEVQMVAKKAEQAVKEQITEATTATVRNIVQSVRKESSIGVKWKNTDGAEGYELCLKDAAGNILSLMETTDTAYLFENLSGGASYQFIVCPFFKINGYKYYGKETSFAVTSSAGKSTCLMVADRGVHNLTWKWRAPKVTIAGYRLELVTPDGKMKTVYTDQTRYKFSSLTAGSTYILKVTPYTVLDGEKNYGTTSVVNGVTKPQKVTLKKVKSPKKKTLKVTWKKTACAGYQIQIAKNKKFTKGSKKYTVGAGKQSKMITGCKRNTKYYVRMRAYVKNSKGSLYYGKWSSSKSILCK